jgi:hypothetical protein
MALNKADYNSLADHKDRSFDGHRNDAFSFWKLPDEWREALSYSIDASEVQAERFLFEKYLNFAGFHLPPRDRSTKEDTYWRRLSQKFGKNSRTRLDFPRWPCESALLEYQTSWIRKALDSLGVDDGWHIAFWPGGTRSSIVLTHDLDAPNGIAQMERVAEIEEKYGFRSACNLPLAHCEINWSRVEALQARGFEFGVRGVGENGRSFQGARDLLLLKPTLERLVHEHGLRGFRAPANVRNAEWIGDPSFQFDTSSFDCDPFEARPGGACSIFPFFLTNVVELPSTLGRSHTIIHFLRRSPLPTWSLKALWIANAGGMILIASDLTDLSVDSHFAAYEELLRQLSGLDAWRALPSAVASWWQLRDGATLSLTGSQPSIEGVGVECAVVRRLTDEPIFQ